jgi:hypothetical protein
MRNCKLRYCVIRSSPSSLPRSRVCINLKLKDHIVKTIKMAAYMLVAGALLNASAVTLLACGHTKKRSIVCPATEKKCDGSGGQTSTNCTSRKYRTQQLSGDFGSEGCGECNTEAVTGTTSADCEKLKGCKLFGANNCVPNTASSETTETRTVMINPTCD